MTQITRFTRVPVYKPRHEPNGEPQTYGRTKVGISALKTVTEAARDGNTVSMREYMDGKTKYMDAEIRWDADSADCN